MIIAEKQSQATRGVSSPTWKTRVTLKDFSSVRSSVPLPADDDENAQLHALLMWAAQERMTQPRSSGQRVFISRKPPSPLARRWTFGSIPNSPSYRISLAALSIKRPDLAERIATLIRYRDDDPDEDPIDVDSLHSAILFLLEHTDLRKSHIGLTSEGHVSLGWRLRPDGLLALLFLSDGQVIYSGGVGPGAQTSGTVHRRNLRKELNQFKEWLTTS